MEAEFVVLIPARMGSTRLPGKMLLDLGGQPLVVRTAMQANRSNANRVWIVTDDAKIAAAAATAGIDCVRSQQSHASGTDRLAEASALLGLADDTIVVNVQGDEPFIPPVLIDQVASLLSATPSAAIATLCTPIDRWEELHNPNIVKVVTDYSGRALLFSRAPLPWLRDGRPNERLPPQMPAYRHVGLYAYRSGFLRQYPQLPRTPLEDYEQLEQLRALWGGYTIQVTIAQLAPVAGVDTAEDLQRARVALAH